MSKKMKCYIQKKPKLPVVQVIGYDENSMEKACNGLEFRHLDRKGVVDIFDIPVQDVIIEKIRRSSMWERICYVQRKMNEHNQWCSEVSGITGEKCRIALVSDPIKEKFEVCGMPAGDFIEGKVNSQMFGKDEYIVFC